MSRSYNLIAAMLFSVLSLGASAEFSTNYVEVSSHDALTSEDYLAKKLSERIKSEKRPLKIAVVDTGLDRNDPRFSKVLCKMGHRNFTDGTNDTKDTHGHGTHVAGLIKQYAGESGYCLVILKFYDEKAKGDKNLDSSIQAFKWASQIGVDIVNFSGGGSEFVSSEYETISSASNTTFIVAAGNESQDIRLKLNKYYPASYELSNIFVVGNVSPQGSRSPSSNYGDPRIVWEVGEKLVSTMPCVKTQLGLNFNCEGQMTGTSQATAVHTGKLIGKILRR